MDEQTKIPPRLVIEFMTDYDKSDQAMNIPIDGLEPEEIKSLVANSLDLMLAKYGEVKDERSIL